MIALQHTSKNVFTGINKDTVKTFLIVFKCHNINKINVLGDKVRPIQPGQEAHGMIIINYYTQRRVQNSSSSQPVTIFAKSYILTLPAPIPDKEKKLT